MCLGEKFKEIRKERNLSQEDFAEQFGVSRQTVSSWENSKSYPDIQTLVKISEAFDMPVDDLLKGDPVMVKTIDRNVQGNRKKKWVIVVLSIVVAAMLLGLGGYWWLQNNIQMYPIVDKVAMLDGSLEMLMVVGPTETIYGIPVSWKIIAESRALAMWSVPIEDFLYYKVKDRDIKVSGKVHGGKTTLRFSGTIVTMEGETQEYFEEQTFQIPMELRGFEE